MKYLLFIVSLILFSCQVTAEDDRGELRERIEPKGYLYGFGLGINQELYKGYDRRVIPLPIIGYRGDKLRVLGPFISYDLTEVNDVKISLQASPRFQGFDESDSYIFEGMEERKFSMDAGVGLNYEKNNWKIGVSSMFDALNKSNGYVVTTSLGKVFNKGPIFIEPSIAVKYHDSNHVDYYYGVKESEINEIRTAYKGTSAVNTTLGLSIGTPIFFGGYTALSLDHTWYDNSISESPLVDTNTNYSLRLFYSRFF